MSKNKEKGTKYENQVLQTYLKRVWPGANRSAPAGANDFGDFLNVDGWLIEARKRDAWNIPGWIRDIYGKIDKRNERHRGYQSNWCIIFASDKRTDLNEDYVVLPAELFFDIFKTTMYHADACCLLY